MEEDSEDLQSRIGALITRTEPLLSSSDDRMDFSTKHSHIVDDALNALKIELELVDDKYAAVTRLYMEICAWMDLKFEEARSLKMPRPAKRDDRLTGLACNASHMSVELVMDELHHNMLYRYRGAKRTIKCICEAVLACFEMLCKNLWIQKSWDADSLRDSIIKAADLATIYVSSKVSQLHFQTDDEQDNFVLELLQGSLTGNPIPVDDTSEMQPSIKVMDDDVVGLSGDLETIKERLLGSQRKLVVISIVGMGGIGKTTLTRKVYKDPAITPRFHIRAWVAVSREFCERDVLLNLLQSIAPLPNEVYREETEQLAEKLYRRLKGWRYFIVLDDIWTEEAWHHMKLCFPDDNNGSRIVLTSRITEVASRVDPENPPHVMNFLGIEDSWELLRKKVYGKEACPRQLMNIGKQIAEKCQGLPLAIEVMAGHLTNIAMTKECWEDVAERVGFPTEVTQMESLSSILSISYNDLPHHLKACFLTMINFPKNFEISVWQLIQFWTTMGFLPQKLPNGMEELTMEEVAMSCFENLIDRSLIMVRKKKFDGKAKLCGIHDLLWDLSMREFRKEGHYFFCNKLLCNSDHMDACDNDKKYVIGICQTLLYFDHSFESDYPINSEGFKLLRVLDILSQSFDHFPIQITNFVNLRYLALATSGNIPDLICKLSNLETLLNYHERAGQMLPTEIWLLARLRHLHVGTCSYLSEPPSVGFEGSCDSLLPNLQSLSNLSSASCTKEVFLDIPNLKQLGINEPEADNIEDELLCRALKNLVNLHQLEILKLRCSSKLERPRRIPDWGSFLPKTIKKLTLSGSNLPWSEMNALAMFPNLEVLKLKDNAFKGEEWEMADEEFLQLKCLLLESLDLIFWKAESGNFPNLRWLLFRGCNNLCRIPMGFGDIYTLELIDVEFSNPIIYTSAIEILGEQMSVGNDKLILHVGRAHPLVQSHLTEFQPYLFNCCLALPNAK